MPAITLRDRAPHLPERIEVEPDPKLGGEGAVYFSRDGEYAVKVYHRHSPERAEMLRHVQLLFRSLPAEQSHFILPPLALTEAMDGSPCTGFLMRRVPPAYQELLSFVLNPVLAARQFQAGKTWTHYLRVARSLANALVVLHGKGCAHSDIHYRNFLVNLDAGDAIMLEIDGVVVPGFLPAQVMGMMGFIAPEVLTQGTTPNERTDRYSLAVLLLQTLLFRNVMQPLVEYADDQAESERLGWGQYALFSEHPSDTRHRPQNVGQPLYNKGALSYRMLTPALQRLTERTFIAGVAAPDRRPAAREWLEALACAADELWMCGRCNQFFPYPHWVRPAARRACPFCQQPCAAPSPVILDLYEEKARHSYVAIDRPIVLGDGFRLFGDILTPARFPPASRRNEPSVGHVEWDRARRGYRLVNDGDGAWVARSAGGGETLTAGPGQSLPLAAGHTLYFGERRRLAVVQEAP